MSVIVKQEKHDPIPNEVPRYHIPTHPQVNEVKKYEEKKKIDTKDIKAISDPVIHEIPVFVAKSLAKKLFTVQFPVRPCSMPYDSSAVTSAKFKPLQRQLELELSLKTDSNNFDKSKAEQLAVNADGKSGKYLDPDEGEDSRRFPSGMMDKQVLVSSKASSSTTRYAIGILSNNELHVTPLENVLTLRSTLGYLDNPEKPKQQELKSDKNLDVDNDEENSDEGSDVKQVTVRFAKTSGNMSDKYKKAKELESQQQKDKEEQWVNLEFNDISSPIRADQSRKLFCQHLDVDISPEVCSQDIFLERLK